MNPTDKELIEKIRRHFNISPFASLTDPYPIRLVELLQYTKNVLTKEPLGKQFENVLNENLWDLMEETESKCHCYHCADTTTRMTRMIVCDKCGNKRCPHATDHNLECTNSNEAGQKGSRY